TYGRGCRGLDVREPVRAVHARHSVPAAEPGDEPVSARAGGRAAARRGAASRGCAGARGRSGA
ncbi:hypothetical protein, partial [Streptomyces viridochromogenes]